MSYLQLQSSFPSSGFHTCQIIDSLEDKCYLKPNFGGLLPVDIKTKLEEVSTWFNTTFRINLLKCDSAETEALLYLLLNLKKSVKYALSEIAGSANKKRQSYSCSTCNEVIEVAPLQDFWGRLQDHEHFENYFCNIDKDCQESDETILENGMDSPETIVENGIDSPQPPPKPLIVNENGTSSSQENPEKDWNDFRFNFVILYDHRVQSNFYPDSVINAVKRIDRSDEYTIQRSGASKGVCLLCPCSLTGTRAGMRARVFKITAFTVKSHVAGQKHLKFAANEANLTALRIYHEFWKSQEPNYQAHQAHFMPEVNVNSSCRCHLCYNLVAYNNVQAHIKGETHKARVIKALTSPEDRQFGYYLSDMLLAVYDLALPTIEPPPRKTEKKADEEAKIVPKCVISKVVLSFNNDNILVLPARFKLHTGCFIKSQDKVKCKKCNSTFACDLPSLKQHIQSVKHGQLSLNGPHRYSFFCEICNSTFKDEDAWDGHFARGPNKHDSVCSARKAALAEYECKTCSVVIYGDELSLSRHISSISRSSGKRKAEVKLPHPVKRLFRSKAFIEDEAKRVVIEANQVLDCKDKVKECCEDLERALEKSYPHCKAYAFGSRISGLGNNQSDLDVFMDIGGMYTGEDHQDSPSQEQFVKRATKLIKQLKDDFYYVVAIPSARTPIIKLHHNFTDLDCDLSFRHGLGVENTRFLRFCIDVQPITQPFILLLKKWSDHCKLNEHITHYALALMAIFYLQVSGYLLSVKSVRIYNPDTPLVIDGWDSINYTVPIEQMRLLTKPYSSSLSELLRDFFEYFSKFNYANEVVCPLLGNTIPKMWFCEKPEEKLPPEMVTYVQRLKDNGEIFRALSPFCVQDPFDLSHNLTKACQNGTITKFKTLCQLTSEFLNSAE